MMALFFFPDRSRWFFFGYIDDAWKDRKKEIREVPGEFGGGVWRTHVRPRPGGVREREGKKRATNVLGEDGITASPICKRGFPLVPTCRCGKEMSA
jgi:hypothetical protein